MKNLFKILLVSLLLSFISCTDNEEIVTENEQIINTQSIDKEDSTNINSDGGNEHDYEEE